MRRLTADIIRIGRQLDAATKCGTCGKSTLVLNDARCRRRRPIPVSPKTHCACPGGPAASVHGKTDADYLRRTGQL